MTRREKAGEKVRIGIGLQEQGRLQEAIELFEEAAQLDPSWEAPLFNLGLVYKRQRRWKESFEFNHRATEADPANQPAWWNLGIAATALGRWQSARSAWRAFGIDVPDGEGPIDFPCGYGPIRLHPTGNAEIVWAYRLDPARAILDSIPLPESGHRWKDVVLNDGAPNGYRKLDGRELPVFDALELLESSSFGTFVARVEMPPKREYIVKLTGVAAESGGNAEDWSTSVRMLCKACSEGRPHQTHDTEARRHEGAHLIGIAARDRKHATKILHAWKSEKDDIRVESLADALEPGPTDKSS
jgi:hypothetical protein